MKETFVSTNYLQTEFAGSNLIKTFNTGTQTKTTGNKKLKITNMPAYWDSSHPKYSKSEICEKLLEFLSQEDWSSAGSKTSFNTIQLLNKYGVIKRFYSKDPKRKHKAYLKLADSTKFYIRNQDQFHYALVSELHGWFEKANRADLIASMFYYNDGYVFVNTDKISIEDTAKTTDGKLRTDMAFHVGKYKIVVEYLENHHDKDKLISHEVDRVRALRLIGDTWTESYEIPHVAFFWQKNMFDPETNRYTFNTSKFYDFVRHVGQVILDYWLIDDEDSYCINKLTQITGNQSLSEQIYNAHNNPNVPIISLDTIKGLFNWATHPNPKVKMSTKWYGVFVDRVKRIQGEILARKATEQKNISAFDELFTDSDDEQDNSNNNNCDELDETDTLEASNSSKLTSPLAKTPIPDNQIVYYEIKSDQVFLTHFGLHVFIDIQPEYLANMYEYFTIRKFYNDITSGLIDAIKEVRTLKEYHYKNQIYGL